MENDQINPQDEAESIEGRYVFVDVVGFSKKTVEVQVHAVRQLNKMVVAALSDCGLDVKNPQEVMCMPTGDGLCVAIIARDKPVNDLLDIHLRVACRLLYHLNLHNNRNAVEDQRFSIRVGINENTDIAIVDINGRPNVAGAGINEAARIMDIGDSNHILVGHNVFTRLEKREKYRNSFKSYNVLVKHSLELHIHQYAPELISKDVGLNLGLPDLISKINRDRSDSEIIFSKGLLYESIRSLIANAEQKVLLVAKHRDWIYPLAPTLIMARASGINVTFSHYPDSADEVDRGHVRFLRQLGCNVVEHPVEIGIPVEGAFADFDENRRVRGVVVCDNPDATGFFGRKLNHKADRRLLETLVEILQKQIGASSTIDQKLVVRSVSHTDALDWILKVPTYINCEVRLQDVSVELTRPLAPNVLLYKVEQARALVKFMEHKIQVDPFEPIEVQLQNGKWSPVVPPVLETHNEIYCVAEGHSRLYSQWHVRRKNVLAFVVRGVQKPCRGVPLFWREITIDDKRANRAIVDEKAAKALARDIEASVHQRLW